MLWEQTFRLAIRQLVTAPHSVSGYLGFTSCSGFCLQHPNVASRGNGSSFPQMGDLDCFWLVIFITPSHSCFKHLKSELVNGRSVSLFVCLINK